MSEDIDSEVLPTWEPWEDLFKTAERPEYVESKTRKGVEERLRNPKYRREDELLLHGGAGGIPVTYSPTQACEGELLTGWLWINAEFQSDSIREIYQEAAEAYETGYISAYEEPVRHEGTYHVADLSIPVEYGETILTETMEAAGQISQVGEDIQERHRQVDQHYEFS